MCMCAKPNKNGEPGYSWDGKNVGVYPVSAPTLLESETLLIDEPGRCGGTDRHSHHFRIVGSCHGGFRLLVRHGGGEERLDLGFGARRRAALSMMMPDSYERYSFMHMLYDVYSDAASAARKDENTKWREYAAAKMIRTRKVKGGVKVWIEPAKVKEVLS